MASSQKEVAAYFRFWAGIQLFLILRPSNSDISENENENIKEINIFSVKVKEAILSLIHI